MRPLSHLSDLSIDVMIPEEDEKITCVVRDGASSPEELDEEEDGTCDAGSVGKSVSWVQEPSASRLAINDEATIAKTAVFGCTN